MCRTIQNTTSMSFEELPSNSGRIGRVPSGWHWSHRLLSHLAAGLAGHNDVASEQGRQRGFPLLGQPPTPLVVSSGQPCALWSSRPFSLNLPTPAEALQIFKRPEHDVRRTAETARLARPSRRETLAITDHAPLPYFLFPPTKKRRARKTSQVAPFSPLPSRRIYPANETRRSDGEPGSDDNDD